MIALYVLFANIKIIRSIVRPIDNAGGTPGKADHRVPYHVVLEQESDRKRKSVLAYNGHD